MIDYAAVMSKRHPNREWLLNGDDYDGLVMLDGAPKPSKKSLEEAWPEVAAEIAAEADQRAAAKVSARAKLAALGLTEAEVAALLGA